MKMHTHACVLLGSIPFTLHAQVTSTEYFPNPSAALSDTHVIPEYNVSGMSISLGDWTVKPVYRTSITGLKTVGLFVFVSQSAYTGDNLSSVYYERPDEDCGEWLAKTWIGAKPWEAASHVKAGYSIPDTQDTYWEAWDGPSANASEQIYNKGFLQEDFLGEFINDLDLASRNRIVETLKSSGYPVADVPFEKGTPQELRGWLIRTCTFFDQHIGKAHTSSSSVVEYGRMGDWTDDLTNGCVRLCLDLYWCLSPPNTANPPISPVCMPQVIKGEWEPDGEPCSCTTFPPYSAGCFTVTFNLTGKATIPIANPPMLVELTGSAGVTTNVCVCIWRRTCYGPSKRTITEIASDCSMTQTVETGPFIQFSKYGWTTAYPADQCQLQRPPDGFPPDRTPCGLTFPTPDNTP